MRSLPVMSKRELFAALAMQGMVYWSVMVDGTGVHEPEKVAAAACEMADALLAKLKKSTP